MRQAPTQTPLAGSQAVQRSWTALHPKPPLLVQVSLPRAGQLSQEEEVEEVVEAGG